MKSSRDKNDHIVITMTDHEYRRLEARAKAFRIIWSIQPRFEIANLTADHLEILAAALRA